ncbi:cytochrome P460 family protein [Guyparkeria sp. GHLCS8-2]|uniref:cytochrome P460 family protein n=1 Tax=Guyparkeria halopsychrophila TaxID=3139421 RepID=UPI0037CA1EC4
MKEWNRVAGRLLPALMVGALLAVPGAGGALAGEASVTDDSRLETDPPFGGPMNIEYAKVLWERLQGNNLVGPDSIRSYPYKGNHPHGQALEYLETMITIDNHEGVVMVKKNYGGEGDLDALKAGVLNEREKRLASITVMFQREDGYDSDHGNWYWAKFQPNGELEKNPKGMSLAGRVAKGANEGCIACHTSAPGKDYVFTHDRLMK